MLALLVTAGLESARIKAFAMDSPRQLLPHLGHGPMRRLFRTAAPTQGLAPTISILILWSLLVSCVAGTLLMVAASFVTAGSDDRSISATTMPASPFFKLIIHLQLLLIITCDHLDVWDVAALLPCCLVRVFSVARVVQVVDDASNTKPCNHATLKTRVLPATRKFMYKRESICDGISGYYSSSWFYRTSLLPSHALHKAKITSVHC